MNNTAARQPINKYFRKLTAKEVANIFARNQNYTLDKINNAVSSLSINGLDQKFIHKKSEHNRTIAAAASANMYKIANIITPEIHLLEPSDKYFSFSIQQDVGSIDGIDSTLGVNCPELAAISNAVFGHYKWEIFYNSDLSRAFLQFMTPSCLDQFKNLFLADELRTDNDRHNKNYFLYKTSNSAKYEGVIAIDLENLVIFNFCGQSKDDFDSFLYSNYISSTPQSTFDSKCYKQRIEDINELIQDGVLSKSNIETLKAILQYNFPAEINKLCKQSHIRGAAKNKIVTPISRLWEYNQNTVGKELE